MVKQPEVEVVNDPNAPQYPTLEKKPSSAQIAGFLKAMNPDSKTLDEGLMTHIGKELLTKVLGGSWKDGLKTFTTLKEGQTGNKTAKYPDIVLTQRRDKTSNVRILKSEYEDISEVYRNRDSYYNIETLVHLASIEQWRTEEAGTFPKDFSFNHVVALAISLTNKTVGIEKDDRSKVLELAKEMSKSSSDSILSETTKDLSTKQDARTKKATKTREKKKKDATKASGVGNKELSRLKKKVESIETKFRSMSHDMDDMLRDLILDINAVMKGK